MLMSLSEQENPSDASVGNNSMASTFRGRTVAKSSEELKKGRESRAAEALRMKDDQLKILSDQNAVLLSSLDKVEEEANTLQMEKLAVEQENRTIRDQNFELQSKARAAETQSKRMTAEVEEKEKQIRILTDQNSELLRLLESEESLAAQLQGEIAEVRAELDEIKLKHSSLLITAKTHEELATKAAREGQLRAEEIRLLRAETEQLKQQNAELKMKTQVEVESLQEQLRVRKEKQYQILEKLQAQEEAKRQADDQVTGMEEQLRSLHSRNLELETQLQVETKNKLSLEDANKELQVENGNIYGQNKELQAKIEKSEKERLRMEAEARDSAEQLREMAEKVFQLLERLKLAELGKNKAMEALKKKEQDMIALQKKNARLIKEATEEGRSRAKAELDIKVLQDQVRALKKHNQDISQKSKEEAAARVKATEENEQLQDKIRTMESRLSFLLNKVQSDEESRLIQLEDRKKLEAQVISFTEKCDELSHKLQEMGESNRVIAQAMRLKQEELNELQIKYQALCKELELRENNELPNDSSNVDLVGAKPGGPDDIDNVRLNEGRGRFYIEAKSIGGGSLLLLRGRKPLYREYLEKHAVNEFLKKAQKTTRFRDLIIEKLSNVYGLLMVEEEEKNQLLVEIKQRDDQIDHVQKKLTFVQDLLATEEDAKRRMLLRYIHAVKEHAMAVNGGSGGVLVLPESNITDEEIHALCALLRNNTSIDELNLRNNNITDDGARALSAVLAGRSGLRMVDLRGNKIGKSAIRILAEALERSERVRHVYVHAGGKIEALGAGRWATNRANATGNAPGSPGNNNGENSNIDPKTMVAVETVCVVDVRDNNQESAAPEFESMMTGESMGGAAKNGSTNGQRASTPNREFQPLQLTNKHHSPPRGPATLGMSASDAHLAPSNKKKNSNTSVSHSINKMRHSTSDIPTLDTSVRMDTKTIETQLRESSWHGRQEGFDSKSDSDLKESIRLKKRNKINRELPPLSDIDNEAKNDSEKPLSRGHSAPEIITGGANAKRSDAENFALEVVMKAKKTKGSKSLKPTDVEKRLLNSPFAHAVVKPLPGEKQT